MRLSILLLLFGFFLSYYSHATHIVGGEFELQHRSENTYRLTMNLYFDAINGSPGALDQEVTVRIFEKATNTSMGFVTMRLRSNTSVPYTSPDCSIGQLQTLKLVYYQDITLNPANFRHPDGYYVVWERCCRNSTIQNIRSPEGAGQVFYMEFPPVVKNNQLFINSSPRLFPPLSDYACLNELFYYDFGGTDSDGDSLVYEMSTPLNGYSSAVAGNERPTPRARPYPEITWLSGYSTNSQISGDPALNIDAETGRLVVKPTRLGLFVFGIKVSEYRNKIKIGEVRRDFQLLVVRCNPNASPVVMAKEKDEKSFYNENKILRVTPTSERCLDIYYTDSDRRSPLFLTARPVNFNNSNYTLSGSTSGTVNTSTIQDSLKATLCFDECFNTDGKVYQMDLIVRDNGCSLPRQDTLRISFIIEPVPDVPPTVSLTTPDRIIYVREGDVVNFNAIGDDQDNSPISLTAAGKDFDMGSQKITFQNKTGTGHVESPFRWEIDCNALQKESYQIEFKVTSDVCNAATSRTEIVEVRTIYENNAPEISTDLTTFVFEMELDETFDANFFGADVDLDQLHLSAEGEGFSLADMGMTFNATPGAGTAEGKFSWIANCAAFLQGEDIKVKINLNEGACIPADKKFIMLQFKIKAPKLDDYIPANIFTPNDDDKNDYFEMPDLPVEFCTATFKNIRIFNRWGKEVYFSENSNFRWDGKGVNDGVYFYVIDFNTKQYKGSVTLVR
ncbi:gliding motility-associated C-terminal domain-containing protein [Pontibacter sp. SGAir0037]|uniref:T9SS type B sorting domain-containing protein n=1 Tax=Pontibacter sp. SGAir0037 TaxID=2571030 RepID=UPI0010CD12FC|nr:gliding motility-associated C-terminal domain-containing protein [Pontibacter sp. SGAir0037]QCR21822.1 hypothetical protein C1N53_05370 [Pontibacter sp. SGAir0037]